MPQELLFELSGARVTPHVATFGGTSYQIANIGSVRIVRRRKYNPFAIILFLLGLGILATAIVKSGMTGLAEEYFSIAATGVAIMAASLLLQLIWPRRLYVLVLRTSGGDVKALTSRNKEFVSNVQKALEQAFVVRARQPPELRAEDWDCWGWRRPGLTVEHVPEYCGWTIKSTEIAMPRELIEPQKGDKRYVRRGTKGKFSTRQVKVGRSLSSDRRSKAKTAMKKGEGDRGDRPSD
jgi:hypothetical protein